MKYYYLIALLIAGLCLSDSFAADSSAHKAMSLHEDDFSTQCNLEARNALVNGDLALVERVCTQAITELEKSDEDREALVNPIMNLAFSYTLTGRFDKATPLYNRARNIREKLYGADSKQTKEIDDMIKRQEEMRKQRNQ
ncbi:MAG: tetratricopeptide repeat protein [Nitrospiraceae bacterium]|nr:MAG: tetratricopeptide repeat protein [Nitrospiraceae bacterium]